MSHIDNYSKNTRFTRSDKLAVIAGFSMIVTLILYRHIILPDPSPLVVQVALFTSLVGIVSFVAMIFFWSLEIYNRLRVHTYLKQCVSSSDIDALLMAHGELLPANVAEAIANGKRVSFKVGITIHE